MKIKAYAVQAPKEKLLPFSYEAGELLADEVEITISHCGICHSDLHLMDNDWGISKYPLVPGHEIIGEVSAVGTKVTLASIGQRVGLGWQCGACLRCEWCLQGQENLCQQHQATAVAHHGGFAEKVRAHERFVFTIPENLSSETAAPLLCAGITVYSPIKIYNVKPHMRIGIIGIGGLGHLALQFYRALGCEVTAFSTSPVKEKEAMELGANFFVDVQDSAFMKNYTSRYDFILSTTPGYLDIEHYLNLLRPNGKICIVGVAPPIKVSVGTLINGNKTICGSGIGDTQTIREMLDFAAKNNIAARIKTFPMSDANFACDAVRNNSVRYRAVLTR